MMRTKQYFPINNFSHSGFSSPDASSSVVFEGESSDEETSIDQKESKSGMNNDAVCLPREIQFLYIQMEFCEKSTLRYMSRSISEVCCLIAFILQECDRQRGIVYRYFQGVAFVQGNS
jgi:hypothetical protein